MEGKKVLVFGLGFFQRGLLKAIAKTRACIAIDSDKNLLDKFKDEIAGLQTIEGEASSIITWKKFSVDNISHIVTSVQDYDVTLEICRIAREVYLMDVPIIVLWYQEDTPSSFEKYRAKVLNPLEIAVEVVMNLIDKNYSKPTNIGLGLGEILEVSILRRSHIVDRKMRYLQPNRWKVAAAYRDNRLIIPDGDFKLQIGDRAILIGEPKVVENIVNILMKGTPEFPLQYGQTLVVLADDLDPKSIFEIQNFQTKTRVRKFMICEVDGTKQPPIDEIKQLEDFGAKKGDKLKNFRGITYLKDIGLIAVSKIQSFTIFNIRMRYLFKNIRSPLLLSRGSFPYSEVLISFNGKSPDRLLEAGNDIAALLGVNFKVVYVTALGALKGQKDDIAIKQRQELITDFENLNRSKVIYTVVEGNPVKETMKIINSRKNLLLVVSANSTDAISVLSPHVPYLLAARADVSVLILPDETLND